MTISIEIVLFIFFCVMLSFMFSGYPVAFVLGGVSVLFGVFLFGFDFFHLLPLRIWGIMTNYTLISVPLFVFMGVMFERSGLAEELLETMALLFGKLRGGLAYSVLFVGALLGASTGIVGATIVTMGILTLPVMLKRGCDPSASCGIIAASGTLGQIIPPSVVLILLGSVLNVPVGDLFTAAVIPGGILVGLFFLFILFTTIKNPRSFPAMPAEEIERFRRKGMAMRVISSLVLPGLLVVLVLGSIFFGIASPTEAAAVGAFSAAMFTILKGRFTMFTLREVMKRTVTITSMAFFILTGATAFTLVFRGLHGDIIITQFIQSAELHPNIFLAVVLGVIFIAGFFIDFIEIIFIIIPIVAPVFAFYKIDFLWLGIVIAMNLQTSFITPPFGFSLFYLKGVAPEGVTTLQIYRGVVPYIILQVIAMMVVIVFPEVVYALPKLLR